MSELKDTCVSKTTTTAGAHTTSRHVPQTEGRVLRSLWPAPSVACPGQPHVRRMRVIATGCGHTRQARAYSRLSKNSIHYGALSQHSESNKNKTYSGLTTHKPHTGRETWASTSSTLLRATRTLAESKAHDGNWLEDCALESHHHREVNRSQTWPTKATWARTNAGMFMSDPGLRSHGCWIHRSGAVRRDGTSAPLHPQICENRAHCEAMKQVSCGLHRTESMTGRIPNVEQTDHRCPHRESPQKRAWDGEEDQLYTTVRH